MSTARELLDQRLARGDIDAETHAKILARLSPVTQELPPPPSLSIPSATPNTAPQYVSAKESAARTAGLPAKVGGFIFGGLVLLGLIAKVTSSDLEVGQLSFVDSTVSFTMANRSSRDRDVVMYIYQDGMRRCEHVMQLRANMSYNTRFSCRNPGNGRQYELRYAWASSEPGITAVATRINAN